MPVDPQQEGAVRAAYDLVAESYVELLRDELAAKPLDRALLAVLAERALPGRPVADLGCGPGRVAAHLAGLGLDVRGLDLSPEMVRIARREHSGLRFDVASLAALPLDDASLGGAVAWYSIIHTPPAELPVVFAELARVLAADAPLLLAFQLGDASPHRLSSAYGHEISLDAYRLPPELVLGIAEAAGIAIESVTVREPVLPERTRQAYLLGRRRPEAEPTLVAPRHPA